MFSPLGFLGIHACKGVFSMVVWLTDRACWRCCNQMFAYKISHLVLVIPYSHNSRLMTSCEQDALSPHDSAFQHISFFARAVQLCSLLYQTLQRIVHVNSWNAHSTFQDVDSLLFIESSHLQALPSPAPHQDCCLNAATSTYKFDQVSRNSDTSLTLSCHHWYSDDQEFSFPESEIQSESPATSRTDRTARSALTNVSDKMSTEKLAEAMGIQVCSHALRT